MLGGTFQKYIFREGNPVGKDNHSISIKCIFTSFHPAGVHYDMFIPALKNLGTTEQQAEYVPRAINCKIIGAYAQTELGHGTFIRGLETTATYDLSTKEFIVHSPTITAYKVDQYLLNSDRSSQIYLF